MCKITVNFHNALIMALFVGNALERSRALTTKPGHYSVHYENYQYCQVQKVYY